MFLTYHFRSDQVPYAETISNNNLFLLRSLHVFLPHHPGPLICTHILVHNQDRNIDLPDQTSGDLGKHNTAYSGQGVGGRDIERWQERSIAWREKSWDGEGRWVGTFVYGRHAG